MAVDAIIDAFANPRWKRELRNSMFLFVRKSLIATLAFTFASLACAQGPDAPAAPAPEKERWLPLLAEEARKSGYELPLPFGAGVVITGLDNRAIEVTDVRIGLRGEPVSVSEFVDLGSTSRVFNANLKFDAWLLPFMNVYALLGYVHNESTSHALVTVPRPGPIPGVVQSEKTVETELDGMIGGLGMTLAGGWREFFMVADVSYVQTDLGFDDEFTALIASVRTGWNGKLNDLPVQLWLGVGNWDTAATAKGHVDIEGVGRLDFEADQQPKTPWIYDIGSQIQFNERMYLFVDAGFDFDGAYVFVVGPTYRF
jgi:hypothetical protein